MALRHYLAKIPARQIVLLFSLYPFLPPTTFFVIYILVQPVEMISCLYTIVALLCNNALPLTFVLLHLYRIFKQSQYFSCHSSLKPIICLPSFYYFMLIVLFIHSCPIRCNFQVVYNSVATLLCPMEHLIFYFHPLNNILARSSSKI